MKNQTTFQARPEQIGGRNSFDHSHPFIASMTMGKLIPFFVKETYPNDTWILNAEFFFRFAPLYLPIMHKVNMSVSYFYVPNRIIWPGTKQDSWEWFIRDEASVEAPYMLIPSSILEDVSNRPTTVVEYMGLPSVQTSCHLALINQGFLRLNLPPSPLQRGDT